MRNWIGSFIALVMFVATDLPAAQQGDAGAGKAVYSKSCATCHGADGAGKDAIAKALKVEMRHLGSPEVQAKSDDAIRKEVMEGVGKMKPVKGLGDKDLASLTAYLRTLKK